MSGATHEVGAPEPRIVVPMELVLTPRGNRLIPGTWTRGHRSQQAYSSVCGTSTLGHWAGQWCFRKIEPSRRARSGWRAAGVRHLQRQSQQNRRGVMYVL
jgi:hypothetical protein